MSVWRRHLALQRQSVYYLVAAWVWEISYSVLNFRRQQSTKEHRDRDMNTVTFHCERKLSPSVPCSQFGRGIWRCKGSQMPSWLHLWTGRNPALCEILGDSRPLPDTRLRTQTLYLFPVTENLAPQIPEVGLEEAFGTLRVVRVLAGGS